MYRLRRHRPPVIRPQPQVANAFHPKFRLKPTSRKVTKAAVASVLDESETTTHLGYSGHLWFPKQFRSFSSTCTNNITTTSNCTFASTTPDIITKYQEPQQLEQLDQIRTITKDSKQQQSRHPVKTKCLRMPNRCTGLHDRMRIIQLSTNATFTKPTTAFNPGYCHLTTPQVRAALVTNMTLPVTTSRLFSSSVFDRNSISIGMYENSTYKNNTNNTNSSNKSNNSSNDKLNSKNEMGYLYQKYLEMVQSNGVKPDQHQIHALQSLERLRNQLLNTSPPLQNNDKTTDFNDGSGTTKSWGSWFFNSGSSSSSSMSKALLGSSSSGTSSIQGLYIHGGVGCGKTFLMNQIFVPSLIGTPWETECQKTHFHKFMLMIHQEMHLARTLGVSNSSLSSGTNKTNNMNVGDIIIPAVVKQTAHKGRLICFDEFQVTDVADALILKRLFEGLWDAGCIVVATSNRAPMDLYKDGLQRDRFVPFIHLLERKCEVVSMWKSHTDYRLLQHNLTLPSTADPIQYGTVNSNVPTTKVFFCPNDYIGLNDNKHDSKYQQQLTHTLTQNQPQKYLQVQQRAAKVAFDKLFYELVGQSAVSPTSLTTQGRKVFIPQAATAKGIARFTFEELCTKALGAADYLIIGQTFHTVFLEGVPTLTLNELNWVRRFIIFIDTMYESNVKLIIHSQNELQNIFQPFGIDNNKNDNVQPKVTTESESLKNDIHHDEVFAFDRTVSRLQEMTSFLYLQRQHKRWCVSHDEIINDNITKPTASAAAAAAVTSLSTQEPQKKTVVEPKASLLSRRRAVVNVIPS